MAAVMGAPPSIASSATTSMPTFLPEEAEVAGYLAQEQVETQPQKEAEYKIELIGNTLFAKKIGHALEVQSYDDASVRYVERLVGKNTVTGYISSESGFWNREFEENICKAVKQLLSQMLNGGGLVINSNEPAFLMNVDGIEEKSKEEVEWLKEQVLIQLAERHNIRPVRIYIGSWQKVAVGDKVVGDGFALTLLNVVNTDVGSPSMIQLLDDESHPSEWHDKMFLNEAWREREFLWKVEKSWSKVPDAVPVPVTTAVIDEASLEEQRNELSDTDLVNSTDDLSGSIVEVQPESTLSEDEVVVSDDPVQAATLIQHPALAELTEREAARAKVQHPTWQHSEGSGSLLDLVRLQASHRSVSSDEAELVEGPKQVPSEDSFELV